ncbi:MAG: hypothetical protein ACO38N_07965, partial [Candidatus Nanopelagicales bacterium]
VATPQIAWHLAELLAWHVFPTLAPSAQGIAQVKDEIKEEAVKADLIDKLHAAVGETAKVTVS